MVAENRDLKSERVRGEREKDGILEHLDGWM